VGYRLSSYLRDSGGYLFSKLKVEEAVYLMGRPITLAFFLICLNFYGAAQDTVDSLRQRLLDTNDNRERVDILLTLVSILYDTDVAEGFNYSQEALSRASDIHYTNGQKQALIYIGYYYVVRGNYQMALDYYRQSLAVDDVEDQVAGYCYTMMANVHRTIANYDSAALLYERSIELLSRLNDPMYLAFAYKSIARLHLRQWKNKSAEQYFMKALEVYDRYPNTRGTADLWFSLSEVSYNLAEYDQAEKHLNRGCDIAQSARTDYLSLLCYKNQGELYYNRGEYVRALEVLFKAMEILKTKDHPLLLASLYGKLGQVYAELGQLDVALKYYFDALKIFEGLGARYEIADLYSEVGWLYKNQANFTLARTYMDRSLEIREEIQDEHGISNSYNVLGVLYYQQKKYNESLAALEKSLSIRRRIGHKEGISACIFNMALVYEDLGQYDKALEFHFRALDIDQTTTNKHGLSISYNQLGELYTKIGDYKEAARYLQLSGDLAQEVGAKFSILSNLRYFSQLYEASGDFKKALSYHKAYMQLSDSIYNEGNALKLAEMQVLYQVEQKNQEIELLNQNKAIQSNQIQLQRSQISQQRTIILAGLVGLALLAGFGFKTYQYTARIRRANAEILTQKEEIQVQSAEIIGANKTIAQINKDLQSKIEETTSALRQAYKELDTFFYRASHDFRRPLTTFLGLSEVAKITVKDAYALELFAKVKETASNLDKMLVKLQSISDVGAQQLVFREVFVKEIVQGVLEGFVEQLNEKDIRVTTLIELQHPFNSYPAMFRIIVENLVENAIAFSGSVDPFIAIRVSELNDDGGRLVLEVEDNGQGIGEQYQPMIFDMYFRGNDRSKGNGLGLYIVKKAVEKLNGTVSFTSSFGQGTVFSIDLPANHHIVESTPERVVTA
jgi:signal transduction histidine kinase